MLVCFYLLLLLHITEGCSLKDNIWIEITAYIGDSVLLPCSCTELHRKPETFTWKKSTANWAQISPERDEYKERFQLVNDHSSGNLSLLISHLTEKDGGDYRCDVKGGEYRDVRLTVKERPSKSTPKNKPDVISTTPTLMDNEKIFETEDSKHSPPYNRVVIISSSVAAVLLLLLILGGVMYWKYRGRGQTKISDGQTGQRTQQKKQDINEPLNLTITSDPTYVAVHEQNDSEVLYAAINPENKYKKAVAKNDSDVLYAAINPESKLKKAVAKDDVTYSSVACSNTVRAANSPVTSEDITLYASIKTN